MDFRDKRIMFFDLETTGVYWNVDAPVQIAAIIECNGEIVDRFCTYVNTAMTISPQASAVHGIYKEDLKSAPKEIEALKEFAAWIKTSDIDYFVGYNSRAFDMPMLNRRCEHFGIPSVFDGIKFEHFDGYYDCVKKAKDANLLGLKSALGRKWNLSAVAQALDIDNEGAHDAMADVEMLRKIWLKLIECGVEVE